MTIQQYTGRKVVLLILAGLVGGATGYFGSGLIIDYLKKNKDEEDGKNGEFTQFIPPPKEEKPDLETLAGKYKSDPTMTIIMDEEGWFNDTSDKETILYYSDGVYANENGEVIEHPASLIGANIHSHFGEQSGDPDIVYVWNARMKIGYEVLRQKESYAKEVLGMVEKPKPKSKPKRTRKDDLTDEDAQLT